MRKLATLIAAAALVVGFATAAQAVHIVVLIIECEQNSDGFEVKAGSRSDDPDWGADNKGRDCALVHQEAAVEGFMPQDITVSPVIGGGAEKFTTVTSIHGAHP